MNNELIDSIANIAWLYANDNCTHDNHGHLYKCKFAELIVKECAVVAHCNFHVDGIILGGILKEHFGVNCEE